MVHVENRHFQMFHNVIIEMTYLNRFIFVFILLADSSTNHQKLTQLNSGDYSSLIPIPPSKNAGTGNCVFSFQREKFVQSGSQVNILNRKRISG